MVTVVEGKKEIVLDNLVETFLVNTLHLSGLLHQNVHFVQVSYAMMPLIHNRAITLMIQTLKLWYWKFCENYFIQRQLWNKLQRLKSWNRVLPTPISNNSILKKLNKTVVGTKHHPTLYSNFLISRLPTFNCTNSNVCFIETTPSRILLIAMCFYLCSSFVRPLSLGLEMLVV